MESVEMKRCTKCGEEKLKSAEFFTVSRYTASGAPVFMGMCRPCRAQIMAESRKADPERHKVYAQRSEVNRKPENIKARNKRRYWKHRARLRESNKVWRQANPERLRVYSRQRYQSDLIGSRARARLYSQARRARKHAAEGSYTRAEWEAKLIVSGGMCHWCAKVISGTPHADHLIPLARGGTNLISNIVPSCAKCNQSKNAKMPWEFVGRLL